jgi:hypothetical protein
VNSASSDEDGVSTPMRRICSGCYARRERPSGHRAAEQRDELASFQDEPAHSITASARASSVGGTSYQALVGDV